MITKNIFTPQLILNWIARILFFTSLSALLPAMPNYIDSIGGNKSQIGIVMSAFALGVLAFRPLIGKKVDSVGRRAVLILGTIIFIISPIIYIFIDSVNTLIPIRVFHGLGLAAFGTASITLITDAAPIQNRGEVISYTGMVNTIAFALGPVLGFMVWEKWGYDILFGSVSMLAFIALFITLLLKETKTVSTATIKLSYMQVIKERKILVASTVILLIGLVHGGVMFYIPLFLKDVGINIGLFFAVYGVAAFLIRLVVGRVSDRFGRGPLMSFSLATLMIAIFTLSQSTEATLVLISSVLYGIGFGSHQPTLTALIVDCTTDETRGKIFSFYYGGFDLGISIAGFLLGTIAEHYGLKNMFLVCCAFTFLALLIFSTIIENKLIDSLRFAFTFRKARGKCYTSDLPIEITANPPKQYSPSK